MYSHLELQQSDWSLSKVTYLPIIIGQVKSNIDTCVRKNLGSRLSVSIGACGDQLLHSVNLTLHMTLHFPVKSGYLWPLLPTCIQCCYWNLLWQCGVLGSTHDYDWVVYAYRRTTWNRVDTVKIHTLFNIYNLTTAVSIHTTYWLAMAYSYGGYWTQSAKAEAEALKLSEAREAVDELVRHIHVSLIITT